MHIFKGYEFPSDISGEGPPLLLLLLLLTLQCTQQLEDRMHNRKGRGNIEGLTWKFYKASQQNKTIKTERKKQREKEEERN